MKKCSFVLSILFTSLFLVGCGGGEDKLVLYPVTGKVTKGGAPLADIKVNLVPRTSTSAPLLVGRTGPDGTFEITAPGGEKGAPEGDYKIVLTPESTMVEADYSSGKAPKAESTEVIPKTYTTADTTEAGITVSKGGENVANIDIP
ncbi:MAG: hypothetical protein KDA78_07195 [Planctomycetaceae bacterium]|nr:hypothetical protein [Planctomycetaceae bacterium]